MLIRTGGTALHGIRRLFFFSVLFQTALSIGAILRGSFVWDWRLGMYWNWGRGCLQLGWAFAESEGNGSSWTISTIYSLARLVLQRLVTAEVSPGKCRTIAMVKHVPR